MTRKNRRIKHERLGDKLSRYTIPVPNWPRNIGLVQWFVRQKPIKSVLSLHFPGVMAVRRVPTVRMMKRR